MTDDFIPTWLIVKKHKKTGLKYFCKTYRYNPITYKGSGTVWRRHMKKHGSDVETIWYRLFENKNELVKYATKFSIENNIIESNEWANLILENGLDGGNPSTRCTEKQKNQLSDTWLVRGPDGNTFEVVNMLEFCRANNLNPSAMSAVARGKRGSHHGYKCSKLTNKRKVQYTHREYEYETKEEKSKRLRQQAVRGKDHHDAIPIIYKGARYDSIIEAMNETGDSYYLVRKYGERT